MKFFTLADLLELEKLLKETLGDSLFTPAQMLRDYESFSQMRAADGWCPVSDMLGKILILLHDTTITKSYIARDKTLRTQAMFPMLRYKNRNDTYASFIIINSPAEAEKKSKEIAEDLKLVIRTQADVFGDHPEKKRDAALKSSAQIISTDYPPKSSGADYTLSFGDGKTVRKAFKED